jgi:hypothetical protein
MEENRYFRFVWRVNGIAIMFLLLFVIGFGGYNFIKEILHRERSPVIRNVAVDPQGEEKWTLARPVSIDGTQFIYIPLVSEKKNISISGPGTLKAVHSYGQGYFAPSRNLLFVNKQTRDMKWLFKDNRQLIADMDLLSVQKQGSKDRMIDAILYQVISKDTNGDKKLTSEDLADIAISNPDGTRFKEVFQSVERIFGAMSVGRREVLVLYQSKGKGYASTIRLQDMSIKDTREMPKTEQAP